MKKIRAIITTDTSENIKELAISPDLSIDLCPIPCGPPSNQCSQENAQMQFWPS